MARQKQEMRVVEISECYSRDLDRAGIILDDLRGITAKTVVRFTTDSTDHFDSESFAEIQGKANVARELTRRGFDGISRAQLAVDDLNAAALAGIRNERLTWQKRNYVPFAWP